MSARRLGVAALALLAGACASEPTGQPVAVVDGAQRDNYWVDRSPYTVGGMIDPCESNIVTAEYTIGGDGRVYDVIILKSRPRIPRNEYAVKNDLFERRFDPASDNPHNDPIRVREEFTIDCGPGKPKWH